jgi:hypothetical protein
MLSSAWAASSAIAPFTKVPVPIDRQLPGNKQQAADAHGLRIVAARQRRSCCFNGFRHSNWAAKVNPKWNVHFLTASFVIS